MSTFPTTSTTLLANLAERESGIDQAEWNRFFALYYPVMVEFARARGAGDDSEDVVQEVLADLVKVFQAGRYVRGKGQFKSYLATMLRNELISRFRRMQARSRIIDGWAGAHASSDIASQCSLRSGDMRTPQTETFLWDGLALIQRGDEQFVNEPHIGGGNPVASSKGTSYFNDVLGNTVGAKKDGKYSAAVLTAFRNKRAPSV